ncbi:MAG: DedA family protein, partial [Deferribacterales bacterium]|nr:DedA family protein [Deferribacterales bacterium]
MFVLLSSLALSGFLSSTLLPGSSEAAFAVFLNYYPDYFIPAVIVITIANGAGSFTSFLIGRFFPKKSNISDKAIMYVEKYGTPLLFFSFLPIIGDLLPLAGGWLRLSIIKSLIF